MSVAELIAVLAEFPAELPVLVTSVHQPYAGMSYLGIQHVQRDDFSVQDGEIVDGPALVIDARVDLDQCFKEAEA